MTDMPTRYAQLPAGSDRNTPRVLDAAVAEAPDMAAQYPEAVNPGPYVSQRRRQHTNQRGGTR